MKTVFELSKEGRSAYQVPSLAVAEYKLGEEFLAQAPAELPEVDEVSLVRHYTELSNHAYGVDNGFYPLGSCTMKYNPKINENVARFSGFANIHPLQDESTVQGALELMFDLQERKCMRCV